MPRFICKLEGLYFEWSTIVDAPVTRGMTLDEFRAYYRDEYGRGDMELLGERLARVEATGTSAHGRTLDEVFECNRAGPNETCATKAEIAKMIRYPEAET